MKKSLAQWDREQQARNRELERVLEKYDQIVTGAWVISTLAKYAFWTTTCITLVANLIPGLGIKIASSQLETVVTIGFMGMIAAIGTTVMGIADRKLDEVHDLLHPDP